MSISAEVKKVKESLLVTPQGPVPISGHFRSTTSCNCLCFLKLKHQAITFLFTMSLSNLAVCDLVEKV